MFGVKLNNKYFEVEIRKGFEIEAKFEEDVYNMLIQLFEFSDRAWEPFRPIHFFNALNTVIPNKLKKQNEYRPSTCARYHREIEEADRIYFIGWICHNDLRQKNSDYDKNVTPENLEKTRKLLSEKAYIRCKDENISSKWTDTPCKKNLDEVYKYD